MNGFYAWPVQSYPLDPHSPALSRSLLQTTPPAWAAAMQAEAVVVDHAGCYTVELGLRGVDTVIWVPFGTQTGLSGDHHLLIRDEVTGRIHDLWEARANAAGRIARASIGKSYPIAPGSVPYVGPPGGTNASNVPSWPWNLTPADVERGYALHALRFPFHYPANVPARYPANPACRYNQPYATPSNPGLGVMVRLNRNAALPAGAGVLERCVFHTLKADLSPNGEGGAIGTDGGSDLTFKAQDLGGGGQSAVAWHDVGVTLEAVRGGVLSDAATAVHGGQFRLIPWHELEVFVLPVGA